MISYITASFKPINQPLDGRHITLSGYRGLLYRGVLETANPDYRQQLHDHPTPKPYSMVPYFEQNGHLAGIRYVAFNEITAHLLMDGWQHAEYSGIELNLGRKSFLAENVQHIPGTNFQELANVPAGKEMSLGFVSPTLFKQGPGSIPLPLPRNVFMRPIAVWNAFAPRGLHIGVDWLDWADKNLFIVSHELRTVDINYNTKNQLVGFVGRVSYQAMGKLANKNLRIWQSLGHFLPLCGTGSRTTIGLGAVERLDV